MTRPTTYAKHAGRKQRQAPAQMALSCDVAWSENALVEFRIWLDLQRAKGRKTMRMEMFREVAKAKPSTHHAWGRFTRMVRTRGLIEFIRYVPAKSAQTRGHPVGLYRITSKPLFPTSA